MQSVIEETCAGAAAGGPFDLSGFTRRVAFGIAVQALFSGAFRTRETQRVHAILDRLQAYVIYPIQMPFLQLPLRPASIERRAAESRALGNDYFWPCATSSY